MTELSQYLECLGPEYSKRVFDAESGAEEPRRGGTGAALARDIAWRATDDDALLAALGEGERERAPAPRRNLRLRLRLTAIKRPSPEISSSPTTRTART